MPRIEPEETQTLDGFLQICRRTGGKVGECISLRIEDGNSRCWFLEAEIGMEQWGQAVSGRGNVPIRFELRRKAPVGLYRHCKAEYLDIPEYIQGKRSQEEQGKELLAPYEVDGWKGCATDLFNSHNTVRPPGEPASAWKRRVSFVRYLDYPMPEGTGNRKLKED